MNDSQDTNPIQPNLPFESPSSVSVVINTGETEVQGSSVVIDHIPESLISGSATVETTKIEPVDVNVGRTMHGPTMNASLGSSWRNWSKPAWEVLKLVLIPSLILAAFAAGIFMLGIAQRSNWFGSENDGVDSDMIGMTSADSEPETTYICPMMCVPPTTKPGRCPVCAMELVPAAKTSSGGPSSEIQIDPRSRRVSGIRTVVAVSQTLFREIRGVGEISYDESRLKTLSAYIDGRIEELYADYTGIEVKQGDSLAMLYSPELYGAQVEFVRTLEFANKSTASNSRIAKSNNQLLSSSRARLIELGLTESQVRNIEQTQTAVRRLELKAPMSGTVIEKMASTGQYLKAGDPVYRLADLSKVWLVLELFPEDASLIQIGQSVMASTQSNHGQLTQGTVEFVEPTVDPKMRTVGVRVALDNSDGKLKPGEFARATLRVPLLSKSGDPQPTVVIPRNSLLSVGQTSLAYVELAPGEFQLRHVKTGPTVDGMVAVFEGIAAGENVVAQSTFLLDAQMQLQGNPSLIDPDKAVVSKTSEAPLDDKALEEIRLALAPLSESDRKLAQSQVICPITEVRLGSMGMGTPIKIDVDGTPVFICCEGCRSGLLDNPEKSLQTLRDYSAGKSSQVVPETGMPTTGPDGEMPQMEMPQMELPSMELPQMELPQMELPQMELPQMELPSSELPTSGSSSRSQRDSNRP